jgi:hypothetical protein
VPGIHMCRPRVVSSWANSEELCLRDDNVVDQVPSPSATRFLCRVLHHSLDRRDFSGDELEWGVRSGNSTALDNGLSAESVDIYKNEDC